MRVITKHGRFSTQTVLAHAVIVADAEARGLATTFLQLEDRKDTIDREAKVSSSNVVLEAGGIYNPQLYRFDTRGTSPQRRKAGDPCGPDQLSTAIRLASQAGQAIDLTTELRKGIPYSCAGSYWEYYGLDVIQHIMKYNEQHVRQRIHRLVAANMMAPVDAYAHRLRMSAVPAFDDIHDLRFVDFIESYNPNPKTGPTAATYAGAFLEASRVTQEFFMRHLTWCEDVAKTEDLIHAIYSTMANPAILVMDTKTVDTSVVMRAIRSNDKFKDVQMVVMPKEDGTWSTRAIPISNATDKPRSYLPMVWRGRAGEDLREAMGRDSNNNHLFQDAIACYNDGNTIVFNSRDSAIRAARFALTGHTEERPKQAPAQAPILMGGRPAPLPAPVQAGGTAVAEPPKAAASAATPSVVAPRVSDIPHVAEKPRTIGFGQRPACAPTEPAPLPVTPPPLPVTPPPLPTTPPPLPVTPPAPQPDASPVSVVLPLRIKKSKKRHK